MNQHLLNIVNFLQQDKTLSEEEKNALLKSVKDADKELEITSFKLDRTEKVKRTTTILLEETIEELEQKRKAVEAQNRELEIESSLERVRAVAMSMMQSDDLLKICEAQFNELKQLGFTDLRNTLIGIFYDDKNYFTDYDYSDYAGGNVHKIPYNINAVVDRAVARMKSASDAFTEFVVEGDELEEWKAFRKANGEYDDTRINDANILYYYFYSIKSGNIGISTFQKISDDQLTILKRFRNVFDLAYKRYVDINNAEAQARESRIETALERVRAVAMAMKTSDDLLSICEVLFKELISLGFSELRNALIDSFGEGKDHFDDYDYSDATGGSITYVPYNSHPIVEAFVKKLRSSPGAFSELVVDESELNSWKEYRKKNGQPVDPRLDKCSSLHYYMYSIGISSIGISAFSPLAKDKVEVLERFANVFKLAYQRYTDISLAEAQAKESQIQLALERVRARTMAMQKSDELAETAYVLFQQFEQLGEDPEQLGIGIFDEPGNALDLWTTINGKFREKLVRVSLDEPFVMQKYYAAWKEDKKTLIIDISGKELKQYNDYRNSLSAVKMEPSRLKERRVINIAYFSKGALSIATSEPRPPETLQLLERFANVFDLTYTRFLDLKKAEAQSREAQIELALERVRARTMAMQKSEELSDTSLVLFQQLKELGEPAEQLSIGIINEAENIVEVTVTLHGEPLQHVFRHSIDEPRLMNKIYKSWKAQQKILVVDMQGEELQAYNKYRDELIGSETFTANQHPGDRRVVHSAFFSKGMLALATNEPRPEESLQLLQRFAKVFDGTYTRFLDLQKAEAQAKEAQIELGLERVRARAMAMQTSEELNALSGTVFTELTKLDLVLTRCVIMIYDPLTNDSIWWMANSEAPEQPMNFTVQNHDLPPYAAYIKAWQERQVKWVYVLEGKTKKVWDDFLFTETGLSQLPDFVIAGMKEPERVYLNSSFFNFGNISLPSLEPLPDEHFDIMLRFAKVFDLTYTRFNDLKLAEAQARESKIEASLERVRSKAMSMQKSEDLANAVAIVFEELDKLNLGMLRCGIGILNKEKRCAQVWTTTVAENNTIVQVSGDEAMDIHPLLSGAFDAWLKGVDHSYVLQGEDLNNYYKAVARENFKLPDSQSLVAGNEGIKQYYYNAVWSSGGLFAFRSTEFPEEAKIVLRRFADVFDFTYTRFNDLKQAEAQAKEAKIEVALERVRSRTLAMQRSDELAETAAVLFQQLIILGIEPNRLYICIVKDDKGNAEFWITDEDGTKVSSAFGTNLNNNSTFKRMFEGWMQKKETLIIDMQGKELQDYFKFLTSINVPFKGGLDQKRRVQDIAYFSNGFIGIASPEDQPGETVSLLERFAAVFNLTYTRFNDLKVAEAHAIQAEEDLVKLQTEKKRAEDALTELRSTQAQLIQSEKMASLGELTAGIAHEIQNPLNFVNNFSEVSKELLDEMREAVEKGDTDEAKEIMNDIIQNLEKINHHGKRADAIVKGMLQHSRASSATKELTDINKLADEYLRLAYHGLRAKDKSFNATLKTEYDESIEPVNVVPQDIGRVILNLITNAFYAVTEKKTLRPDSYRDQGDNATQGFPTFERLETLYEPTVTVSTKKISNKIEIKVADNGKGIPAKVLDKIFQPFFTTKPTGQGTGLGLSLAYDIVKAHGGELKVETKEGEGSTFTIQIPIN